MSFMDKLLGFGGLLLTGILVNSLDDIIKKFKDFKANNQGLFTAVGNVAKFIKNTFTYLFDQLTTPFGKKGSLDWLAKFKDDGTLESGKLKEMQDVIEKLNPLIKGLAKFTVSTVDRATDDRGLSGLVQGKGWKNPLWIDKCLVVHLNHLNNQ